VEVIVCEGMTKNRVDFLQCFPSLGGKAVAAARRPPALPFEHLELPTYRAIPNFIYKKLQMHVAR
jgi:hypothetical protein